MLKRHKQRNYDKATKYDCEQCDFSMCDKGRLWAQKRVVHEKINRRNVRSVPQVIKPNTDWQSICYVNITLFTNTNKCFVLEHKMLS
jgi:hypothetical protein